MLFWDPFEFILAISAFGFLMILANPMVGLLAAGVVLWGGKKLKRGAKKGAAQHALWGFGVLSDSGMSNFPSPTLTEFIE